MHRRPLLGRKYIDDGSRHGQWAWAALLEKLEGRSREALRAVNARMYSARLLPDQDPQRVAL